MPLLWLLLVVLDGLIAMNTSEINHEGRPDQHHLDPEGATDRELIVIEGPFDRPDGGFNGHAEMAALGLGLAAALTT